MSEQPAMPTEVAPEVPAQAPEASPPAEPKPAEIDWKAESRKWEERAKTNAASAKENEAAARRLREIEDAQKSEAQRQAEAIQLAKDEARMAQSQAARYRVAVRCGLDETALDLLGDGDEEAMTNRGQQIASMRSAAAELAAVKAELEALKSAKGMPTGIPVASLKPGAAPVETPPADDAFPAHWIPQRAIN